MFQLFRVRTHQKYLPRHPQMLPLRWPPHPKNFSFDPSFRPTCIHCNSNHSSTYKGCQKFKVIRRNIILKTRDNRTSTNPPPPTVNDPNSFPNLPSRTYSTVNRNSPNPTPRPPPPLNQSEQTPFQLPTFRTTEISAIQKVFAAPTTTEKTKIFLTEPSTSLMLSYLHGMQTVSKINFRNF